MPNEPKTKKPSPWTTCRIRVGTLNKLRDLGREVQSFYSSRTSQKQIEKLVIPEAWDYQGPLAPHLVVEYLLEVFENSRGKNQD
ncbi:MAG: hypothetical protein AAF662_05215 [Pseudomonadota bacterium]